MSDSIPLPLPMIHMQNWTNHHLLEPPKSFLWAGSNFEDVYSGPDNPLWLFLAEHFPELWRLGNGFVEFIQWLFQYLQRRRHEPPTEVPVH